MTHVPLFMFAMACGTYEAQPDLTFCQDDRGTRVAARPTVEAPTWHQDVAPVVEARCAGCHEPGGIAPFALQTPEDLATFADAVFDSVVANRMPPWPPEDCCGKAYLHSRRLPDAERADLLAWLEQGRPLGDPNEPPRRAIASLQPGPTRVDAIVEMAEPYTPQGGVGDSDEIRCFLLDVPEAAQGRWITGLRFEPGERSLVHHVVLGTVEGRALDRYLEQDRADPGPGWDCYEGTITGLQLFGGWVPGAEGADFPDGFGARLPEGGKILANMHYDLSAAPPGAADQSRIALQLEDDLGADLEATTFAVLNPLWLFDNGMRLEPDFAETTYAFHWDPQPLYGQARTWNLHKVFLHMHEFGVSGRVAVLREDGRQDCLLDVGRWDFAWHGDYWLEEPVRLAPGDRLYVECSFVNPTPRALRWGADEEMCSALVSAVEVQP